MLTYCDSARSSLRRQNLRSARVTLLRIASRPMSMSMGSGQEGDEAVVGIAAGLRSSAKVHNRWNVKSWRYAVNFKVLSLSTCALPESKQSGGVVRWCCLGLGKVARRTSTTQDPCAWG